MFGLLITLLNKYFPRARSSLQSEKCLIPREFLSYERSAMQDWLIEEWKCATMAIKKNESEEVVYQMVLHAEFLAHLCNNWQDKTRIIDPHKPIPDSWGPPLKDLMEAQKFEMTAMVAENEGEIYDDDNEEGEEDEDDEGGEEEGERSEEHTSELQSPA